MNVAIYYPWVYLRSGCERTIAEVTTRSRHQWTVFTNRFEPESTFPVLREKRIVELPRVSVQRSFSQVGVSAWKIGRQRLPLDGQDALVIFCEGLGDFINFRDYKIPVICLCFTPLRAAFDPHYQREYLAMNGNGLGRRIALGAMSRAFRFVDRLTWKKYSRIFAISEEVRRRILRGKLCTEDQVEVIYPGVDLSHLKASSVYEKYFLISGRIMWTKNIELGMDAFRLLLERRPDLSDFSLTIAGFVDQKSKPYITKLRDRAADCPQIRFIEAPSDQQLFALYQNAYSIVYTPFNEDWGLVPLEAMASEKPVIAVNRGGPLETVLDGQTGLLVEPAAEAFAAAMERLADDPALVRSMGVQGRQHAGKFNWESFCDRMDQYLDQIAY
jgi:glycosyltransferase involved in cell wall biosynthesis